MPGYAHVAGREAALSALGGKRRTIEDIDYSEAILKSQFAALKNLSLRHTIAPYIARKTISISKFCSRAQRPRRTIRVCFPRRIFVTH